MSDVIDVIRQSR